LLETLQRCGLVASYFCVFQEWFVQWYMDLSNSMICVDWYRPIPLQAWTDSLGSRSWRLSEFLDNGPMKVVRLTALHTGHLYPPGKIPGTHFCESLSRSQDHSAAGGNKSMKIFNYAMGKRTRDLPGCSAVPDLIYTVEITRNNKPVRRLTR
jgi:hypothetical protein